VTSSGFRKDEEVFSFHITFSRAFLQTCRDILAMLIISSLLSCVVWVYIREVPYFLKGIMIEDSANEQFGYGNYTIADYGREDFFDKFAWQRDRSIKQLLTLWSAFSGAAMSMFIMFGLQVGIPYLYYPSLLLIMAFPGFLPSVYYAFGGKNIGSGVVIFSLAIFAGISVSYIAYVAGGHYTIRKFSLAWKYFGNLAKSVIAKTFITLMVLNLILLSIVKSP